MTKLASLLTLTLFHVAACGGNDAAPIAIAELPHEFAHVFCERTFDCCSEAELADEFAGLDPKPTTVEECVEVVEGIIEFEDEQAGIDAGRVIYDAAIAGTCLEEFRGIACTGDLDDSDCTPFVGQVALGDECASSVECANGAVCNDSVCQERAELGDACPAGYCDDNSVCSAGTCVAPPGIGEECPDFTCAGDAFCDSAVTPSVCTALRATGEPCDGGYQCETGQCDDGLLECVGAVCDGN